MFVEIHQDYDGSVTHALSYKYKISVYRDRSMVTGLHRSVLDKTFYTNEISKAQTLFDGWAKEMDKQKTLINVVLQIHDDTDHPVTLKQKQQLPPV